MKFVYVTDTHGNTKAIEQTFEFATHTHARAVVFGGDLTPSKFAVRLNTYSCGEGQLRGGGEIIPLDMLQKDDTLFIFLMLLCTKDQFDDTIVMCPYHSQEMCERIVLWRTLLQSYALIIRIRDV